MTFLNYPPVFVRYVRNPRDKVLPCYTISSTDVRESIFQ